MSGNELKTGKLPAALLRELLGGAGPDPADVLLGPRVGEDACVIRTHEGVLVAATDPVTLTGRSVGAHAVVINANDVAVTGARPRWFLACVLMPQGSDATDLRLLFEEMRGALTRIGARLVGGHTEVTSAVVQPLVVGQMLGVRGDGHFVRTGGMAATDVVLQVGAAPVEAAAVLAGARLGSDAEVPAALLERAARSLEDPGISVVEPALLCADDGASAMHDPTEGGLAAGLWELAEASGLALRVDPEAVLWFAPGQALCSAAGIDPWGALASGTLLAAFPENRVQAASERLRQAGFEVSAIAVAEAGEGVRDPRARALPRFERDEVVRFLAPD